MDRRLPDDWLHALPTALAGGDCVLVTVARTQGSAPRGAGTSMLVGAEHCVDTIGGGHLEWQAIHQVRRLLDAGDRQPALVRYNLGARLGQCCGGVVWLLFETLPATSAGAWRSRISAVDRGIRLQRRLTHQSAASDWQLAAPPGSGSRLEGDAAAWHFCQEIVDSRFPVMLFGAGHVARALVSQLRPLGARITWIDSRDDAFADVAVDGICTLITDIPESEVRNAPAGSYFVVMTHNHSLDFALCEEIFKRRDFAYFGLIGSHSKRASFARRLCDRGLPAQRLDELTCPIGIAGIVGKEPAVIALSVAAQMLQIENSRQLLRQVGQHHLSDLHRLPEEP
jgi:xanthine dehydrogenase accessory factor